MLKGNCTPPESRQQLQYTITKTVPRPLHAYSRHLASLTFDSRAALFAMKHN